MLDQSQREFALADAHGKPFRKARGRLLAVGRDELGEGSEQAGLGEAVSIDAIDARLSPGLLQIPQRHPFLLMIKSLPMRGLNPHDGHVPVSPGGPGPPMRRKTNLARGVMLARTHWRQG